MCIEKLLSICEWTCSTIYGFLVLLENKVSQLCKATKEPNQISSKKDFQPTQFQSKHKIV